LLSITLPCSHLKASLFLSLLFTLPCSQ
jgi:hypothetical protein